MRFFRKRQNAPASPRGPSDNAPATCLHVGLAPQWADLNDMGVEAKATSWRCAACGTSFTPEEAATLRENEAERLKHVVGAG